MQKNMLQNTRKKTHKFHKTWPTELSVDTINLYEKIHYVYYFCDVLSKIKQFLNLFMNKLYEGSLKMSTKYCIKKSEEKKLPISLKYALEIFPFIPYILVYEFWDNLLKIEHFLNLFRNKFIILT